MVIAITVITASQVVEVLGVVVQVGQGTIINNVMAITVILSTIITCITNQIVGWREATLQNIKSMAIKIDTIIETGKIGMGSSITLAVSISRVISMVKTTISTANSRQELETTGTLAARNQTRFPLTIKTKAVDTLLTVTIISILIKKGAIITKITIIMIIISIRREVIAI